MAGQEVSDVVLRLRADASDLNKGFGEGKAAFDGLKTAGLALGAVFAIIGAAVAGLVSIINRGQGVSELTTSFQNLEAQAGGNISALSQLKDATQGLISDTDLMRASNEALLAGLKPDQFLAVAKSADTLGDSVGVNTKTAMDQLVTALTTGNERLLKQYGILIDNKKAEADFAASIGTTADKLNEAGKREAARIAILAKMEEQTAKLGTANDHAGDVLQKLGVTFSNTFDEVARFINENGTLVSILKEVAAWADAAGRAIHNMISSDLDAQIERIKSKLSDLQGSESTFARAFRESDAYKKTVADLTSQLEGLKQKQKEQTEAAAKNTTVVESQADALKKYTGESEKAKHAAEELQKKIKEQTEAFKQLTENTDLKDLTQSLQDAVSNVDVNNFGAFFDSWKEKLGQATEDALRAKFKDALASGDITEEQLKQLVEKTVGPQITKMGDSMRQELEKKANEAFQNSFSFFEDIATTTITGSAQNIEQILTDALKRVAIGFGAQLLASVTASFGIGGIGGAGSASGLGQSLAASLGFGGGGVSTLGQLFGGATDLRGSLTAEQAMGSLATTGTAASSALASLAAVALPFAAALGAVGAIGLNVSNILQGKNVGAGSIGLAVDTIFPGVGSIGADIFGGFFGGGGKGGKEKKDRENFLAGLPAQSFQGVRGQVNLDPGAFNIDTSNELNAQSVGIGNALATATGAFGKLGSDAAAIFANAIASGKNFNEVLINAKSEMKAFGLDANKAKDLVTQAFLEGKISLEQLNAEMGTLNVLGQDTLQGPNGIAEGMHIFADSTADPQARIQALGLEFNTLASQGIKDTASITAYMTSHFGPDAGRIFHDLAQIGIKSFSDIKNLSSDQILALFNLIQRYGDQIGSIFQATGDDIGNGIAAGVERGNRALKSLGDTADAQARRLKNLTLVPGGNGRGIDTNQPLTKRAR